MNLVLVGAGGIGAEWARAIKETKGVSLRGIADVKKERAQALAKMFRGCAANSDYAPWLRDKTIDAFLVLTPHKWLAPVSYAALCAKKHVLCEKPGAVSSAEIEKNILRAAQNRLVYMVGFNHRYHPAYLQAKKVFSGGIIGAPLFLRARYGFGGRPGYAKEWRMYKQVSGGGELLDQGSHMIDAARLFLGDMVEVQGMAPQLFWKNDVEDNGFALLRSKTGAVASIHVSWTNWRWVHSVEIEGEKGYLRIDGLDQRYEGPERLTVGKRDLKFAKPPTEKTFVFKNEQKHHSLARELAVFKKAISGDSHEYPSGKDAQAMLAIVEQIYAKEKKQK